MNGLRFASRDGVSVLLAVPLVGLALQALDGARYRFEWLPAAIELGQPWRFVTAHWVHLGGYHALLNWLAWACVWCCARGLLGARGWLVLLLACALGTSVGLSLAGLGKPYLGFSGVVHGLWAFVALEHARRGALGGIAGCLALAVKLALEARFGHSAALQSALGAEIASAAHVCGSLSGAACSIASAAWASIVARVGKPEAAHG